MIIAIYFIIAIITGVISYMCRITKDIETSRSRDYNWLFWLELIVLALLWPILQLWIIISIVGRFKRAMEIRA